MRTGLLFLVTLILSGCASQAEKAWNRGAKLYDQGNYGGAAEEYKKAVELDPRDAVFTHGLALAFYKDGKKEESVQYFLQAAQRMTEHIDFFQEKGWDIENIRDRAARYYHDIGFVLYETNKNIDTSIFYLQAAVKLNSNNALTYWYLSNALERKGDFIGAMKACEEANKIVQKSSENYWFKDRIPGRLQTLKSKLQ